MNHALGLEFGGKVEGIEENESSIKDFIISLLLGVLRKPMLK